MKKTLYDGEHFQVVLESKKPLVKGVKTDLHKMAGVMLAAGAAWGGMAVDQEALNRRTVQLIEVS